MIRQARPGERLSGQCGHHCGIRPNAEGTSAMIGHCPCGECRCPESGHVVRLPNGDPWPPGNQVAAPDGHR